MGKHRVIPCTPPADPDALLVDDATAREHIDTLRDVTTEIARTVAGLDGRATPHDVQQKLAAVLAGAAPPSPDLKRDARRRDALVPSLLRAARRSARPRSARFAQHGHVRPPGRQHAASFALSRYSRPS